MELRPFDALIDFKYAISIGSTGFNTWNDINANMDKLIKWCHEHIGRNNFSGGFTNIYFKNEKDRTLFILRWS